MDGLLRAQFAYPQVEFCVISPDQALNDGFYPLNFEQKDVDALVAQGQADGTKALTDCAMNTQAHMQYYALKRSQDPRTDGLDFETFKAQKVQGLFEEFDINAVKTTGTPLAFLQ